MAQRLWEKGEGVNEVVHRFTVGSDPEIDRQIAPFDAIGSAAHVRMLGSIGLMTEEECAASLDALKKVFALSSKDAFEIPDELEDCHTAIESFITENVGEAGRRVHTGRSRNDQVLLAMRLFMRAKAVETLEHLSRFVESISARYTELSSIPIPGYTHMQPAMPSSIGMWLHSYAEWAIELMRAGTNFLQLIDSNPLGAGAGFGTSLPLNRRFTADLLKFKRVQRSPIDAQNSRGRYELQMLRWLSDIGGLVEKLAWDLELFTMEEFGYFSLSREMTTGSSIMPQKHNPDVVELMRASAGKLRGAESELAWIIAKLPSSYHRDFQYTKEPVIRAIGHAHELVRIASFVMSAFNVHEDRIAERMVPELYATYDAYRAVNAGVPFRDAYRQTAEKVKSKTLDVKVLVEDFRAVQHSIDASMEDARRDWKALSTEVAEWREMLTRLEVDIFEG